MRQGSMDHPFTKSAKITHGNRNISSQSLQKPKIGWLIFKAQSKIFTRQLPGPAETGSAG